MTASAGRQPAENKSASTESRRVGGVRADGRRLWLANPPAKKNSDAFERLIGATVSPATARVRAGSPGSTASPVGPATGLP